MAHLHHRHAGAVPVEHLVGGLPQHRLRDRRGTRREVVDARHSRSRRGYFFAGDEPFDAPGAGAAAVTASTCALHGLFHDRRDARREDGGAGLQRLAVRLRHRRERLLAERRAIERRQLLDLRQREVLRVDRDHPVDRLVDQLRTRDDRHRVADRRLERRTDARAHALLLLRRQRRIGLDLAIHRLAHPRREALAHRGVRAGQRVVRVHRVEQVLDRRALLRRDGRRGRGRGGRRGLRRGRGRRLRGGGERNGDQRDRQRTSDGMTVHARSPASRDARSLWSMSGPRRDARGLDVRCRLRRSRRRRRATSPTAKTSPRRPTPTVRRLRVLRRPRSR